MRLLKTLDFTELEWMIKIYDIQNRAKYKKQLICERIKKTLKYKNTVYSSEIVLTKALINRDVYMKFK